MRNDVHFSWGWAPCFGTLDTTLEGAIVDLVELMDQADEHGEPRGPA